MNPREEANRMRALWSKDYGGNWGWYVTGWLSDGRPVSAFYTDQEVATEGEAKIQAAVWAMGSRMKKEVQYIPMPAI